MNVQTQNPPQAEPEADAFPTPAPPTESDLLCQELANQKDLNSSLIADFDNFRRRTREESESRAAAQKESFIQDLLPFIDNLERALASGAAPGSKQFHQGVEMTLQQLRQLLRQHGIETEESIGEAFDAHRHEAISQRHDPTQADRAILEVFQRGYRRGSDVFRPAKVVVNDLTPPKRSRNGH
jgi:molecular chaperone GrpE